MCSDCSIFMTLLFDDIQTLSNVRKCYSFKRETMRYHLRSLHRNNGKNQSHSDKTGFISFVGIVHIHMCESFALRINVYFRTKLIVIDLNEIITATDMLMNKLKCFFFVSDFQVSVLLSEFSFKKLLVAVIVEVVGQVFKDKCDVRCNFKHSFYY